MGLASDYPIMLITGGSRGIGAATARLAARQGYNIVFSYVTSESDAVAVAADVEVAGRQAFAVNAIGPMLCAQQAAKRMAYRHGGQGGSVVNVSSIAAKLGSPNEYVDYAASKGALETFTIGFAKEVAREGIRVNCVRPGHIYTDMHASGGEPGRVERLKDSIPMGRGGQPEEVARAILWLASAEASFITGTFLDATGGK
ncbi:SDR family oxidoreductase [Alcaligenes parafaecalis]|uniref:SDR family oxidoreductase n=1 Tax=Alcaligenes parafaecalis TaxID=171260 RepID=A0ABT3VJN6_9BURK|nr:SDR family oxidoreductase [Alcaligenes parafaecalis]MCX5463306.1 SDR family oxidoreductase [Alcaligenes parafaecalis]